MRRDIIKAFCLNLKYKKSAGYETDSQAVNVVYGMWMNEDQKFRY